MAQRIDTIVLPKWTLLNASEVCLREDAAVAVDAGRIVDICPAQDALERYAPDALHERAAHVLMPGLVNAHCHAGMALMRGYADDLPFDAWLSERIWPAESRLVTPEFVADGTRLAIAEMLLGGITCFADMYYFPDIVAEVAIEAGIRVSVGMIALEFPTVWAETPDEYISKGLQVHDRYRGEALVSTAFAPHAPYSVADATLKKIRNLADELGVPVHTHVHETAGEIEESLRQTGQRPLARLAALGLVSPALMAVHATQLLDEEIELLATAGSSIVHCPRSNLKLASGACPVPQLLAAGSNVALGTDGAASNNRLDIFSELELAALLGKLTSHDATALPAAAAVQLATLNGAKALGLESETGSLEAGKAADLICVDLSELSQQPVLDPLSQLVYSASRSQVSDVWVAGEHLVAEHSLARMDESEISAAADQWVGRLRSS